ncbi:trimethylamine-N-oxide reductase TorA [Rhodopseudomonas palustris]|uniref:Dimethyl sulfoxide/trimethylamine N-oxide reductase n=1 Tax=Rhodopseudomonas palustris (strain BisB18) TaxID=316056 RepID=Q217X6_RHOPB
MTIQSIDQFSKTLSRRSVLNGGAALAALGIFGPSLLAQGARAAGVPDGEVLTGSHWGAFRAKVEGGRITSLKPWEKDPAPSHQLPGVLDSVYSPTRIKYPMVRRAFLEKGAAAERDSRGSGDFVRVTWDQALDLVAKEMQRVDKTYGPAATYAGSYGWKSPGRLHNCRSLLRRLMNVKGSFVSSSGDYSTGAAQIIMPHVVGSLEVYEQQTVWPVVVENTELMVFWGCDPAVTNQIGWLVPDHGAYEGLNALKAKGTKVICIDPIRTKTCETMSAEWIAPRPQTDVAMMLGIAHTLYTEKLHNVKFLKTYTTGFDKFLPYLTGEKDGTPKTAEWAAAICEIPADTIRDLARRFAKGRTMLAAGWSMQRQHHGEQAHWMLVTLAAMLGQIGLPGGGFGFSYHYSNGGAPAADAPALTGITDGGKEKAGAPWLSTGGASSIPVARVVDMLLNPGKEFDFNGTKGKYPDVKLVYWAGGNPFVHHQDRNRMVAAWSKVETFIVQDFQWTPTARHADIVLPVTTAFERNDIETIGDYAGVGILAMKKVVDPVYESRNDYDIFAALAERCGKGKEFTEGKTEMDWIKSFYEAALTQAKAKKYPMPEFDEFWNGAGVVEFPVTVGKSYVRYAKFREDPLLEPLGTPTGKFEIFSRNIEKMGYDDCGPHPMWMEPAERLGGPTAKFPLHIATSHPASRLHSQLCGTKLRETYQVAGHEPCLINPKDAEARGIKDGDVVRVFNDRGQILAGAKVTENARPGVIRVNEGGWYDPAEPGKKGTLCRYGDVNVLTMDIGTSKLAQGNCGHTVIGNVEKYTGPAVTVGVFTAPAGAA